MDNEYDLAARRLRDVAAAIGTPRCTSEIRFGRTADEIVRAGEELHADLVVVGKHSRRRGIVARLGSTAEEIVRSSRTPVLLVTEQPDADPRTLLPAVNDPHVAPWVVHWARFLAERFGASATVMHVVGASVFTSALASIDAGGEAAEAMPERATSEPLHTADDWLSRLAGHDANRRPLHVDVMFGDPAEEIIAAATRMRFRLRDRPNGTGRSQSQTLNQCRPTAHERHDHRTHEVALFDTAMRLERQRKPDNEPSVSRMKDPDSTDRR